ncbi:MAG: hypothetical protein RIC55_21070 [Pirellulaceae bacterium]
MRHSFTATLLTTFYLATLCSCSSGESEEVSNPKSGLEVARAEGAAARSEASTNNKLALSPPALTMHPWKMPAELAALKTPSFPPSDAALTGRYTGVMFMYRRPFESTVEWKTDPNGALRGVWAFHLLDPRYPDHTNDPNAGSMKLSGTLDRATRTYTLKFEDWAKKPKDYSINASQFRGVYSADGERFAGTMIHGIKEPGFFVFARPDTANKEIIVPVRDSVVHLFKLRKAELPDDSHLVKKFGKPDSIGVPVDLYAAIEKWAQRHAKEFPDGTLFNPRNKLENWTSLLLFNDEHFKIAFGKSFHDLTEEESFVLRRAFGPNKPPWVQKLRPWSPLAHAYGGKPYSTGYLGRSQVITALHAQRVYRQWRADMKELVARIPPPPNIDRDLGAVAKVAAEYSFLWPSEEREFETALAAARKKLPGPAAYHLARSLIENAADLSDAPELAGFEDEYPETLADLSAEDRQKVIGWVDARLDAILAPIAAAKLEELKVLVSRKGPEESDRDLQDRYVKTLTPEELREYEKLETDEWLRAAERALGIAGAPHKATTRWMILLLKEYPFAIDRPPFKALLAEYRVHRNAILDTKLEETQKLFNKVTRADAIRSILKDVLNAPGDRQSTVGLKLVRMARDAEASADHRGFLAKFSEREQKWLNDKNRVKPPPGTKVGPPTSSEIGLAYLRAVARQSGDVLDTDTVRYDVGRSGGAFGLGMIIDISVVGVVFDPDKDCKPDPRGGFTCTFTLKTSMSLFKGPPVGGVSYQRALAEANRKTANEGTTLTARLELTEDGWRSPTMDGNAALNRAILAPLRGEN